MTKTILLLAPAILVGCMADPYHIGGALATDRGHHARQAVEGRSYELRLGMTAPEVEATLYERVVALHETTTWCGRSQVCGVSSTDRLRLFFRDGRLEAITRR